MTQGISTSNGDPADARTPWALVVLLGSLTALAPISIDMYLPALPAISHDFGAEVGAAQATLAAFFTGLAIGQFFYGSASDRWGRRWPLLGGVTLYVFASVACALSRSLEMLVVARFLQGLGGCAGQVIARAVVRDRFAPRQSAQILSRLMLIMGIAPIVAPLAGGWLLGASGWRSIFGFVSVFSAIVGVWMFFSLRETRSAGTAARARSEHPVRAYLTLLRERSLVGYTLSSAFGSGALFAYIAASPGLLIQTYHIHPAQFGYVFGVNAMGLIAVSQLNAHLLRRHSPEVILVHTRPISLVFAALLAVDAFMGWGGMWGVLIPLFLVIASFGFIGANTQSASLNVDPLRSGSISALLGGAGFAAGALIAGLTTALTTLWPHSGAKPMAGVILAAIVGATLSLYGLAKPRTAP